MQYIRHQDSDIRRLVPAGDVRRKSMQITLYNTFDRTLEEFETLEEQVVSMYACGPTVYNYAHIGNLRTYLFEDFLRRVLEYSGFRVKHVMNITDVGHLTGDNDEGEDKMVKSSRESGKSVWEIAGFYTDAFFRDTKKLNIIPPTVACKATDHIQDMIKLIQRLEEKGHTYTAGGNVYFSIDTFPDYGKMAGLRLEELQSGARIEVDTNKRNPKDFALWFTRSKFENQAMVWDSPWGKGYPGWHIECSAMSMKYLGEQFDIHCGGTDHINVHHTNEIAQSEAATGKPWVKYWLHGEFLIDDSGKMSKSKGEFLTLSLLEEKGYDPLDYRYFCLGAHYRSQLQFSFDALDSARNARLNLLERVSDFLMQSEDRSCLQNQDIRKNISEKGKSLLTRFQEHIGRDLNMPRGLSVLWKVIKDQDLLSEEKLLLIKEMDRVFGLSLLERASEERKGLEPETDAEVERLLRERSEARSVRDYSRADEIRDILQVMGIEIKDTASGTTWRKKV
jgi:cysteinyl-tRNA synthetase